MSTRPVLVTGGAGFIGSHVVDRLLADGHQVVVLDDLSSGSPEHVPAEVPLEILDLAGPDGLARIERIRPGAIVHCAAQTSVSASLRDPVADARVNVLGSLNAIEGALRSGCGQLVYVTSGGAIYGENDDRAHVEDEALAPKSPYGLSKWTVERYMAMLLGERLPWTALRLANVYGPRQRADLEGGVVSIFLDRMVHGDQVEIFGDGEQTRDFVFVSDVVEAVVLAMRGGGGPMNIGTGGATSVNTLFAALAALTGYRRAPVHAPEREGDLRHSRLDPSRAAALLGWRPATSMEAGLRRTLAAVDRPPGT